ncbi:NEDD4-binding protein 3-A [Amphibalanus amphitrite]|uniref:NEDD4-binding protein 3-A n=2 Tax=Amphibalanus amphitrite TaxID=1232801 RepID=A0A6A4X6W8_AMPAM|nr:NEDD4-binding protein 3-A [Amphibalanus amphitrite]
MLLTRMASALARRRQASPIYESADEPRDETPSPSSTVSCGSSSSWYHGVGGCVAMARVDSGHETLADDDSPTPTYDSDGADLNSTLSEQHIYEEVASKTSRAPPKLPAISGVLQNTGPVIRPVACRPTPTHTPAATPTRFGSVERINIGGNRTAHYGSALELKSAGGTAGDRRASSNMARARYESLDNLRSAAAGEPYSSAALLDEYRGLRGARAPEPRRESFSGRSEAARPSAYLARHDSLQSLSAGGGGGGRIGGSVQNLAGERRDPFQRSSVPRAGSVNSERLAYAAAAAAGGGLGAYGAGRAMESAACTPSPSDSGVSGLEAILRERDSEINFLRETMEQNEQVIFSVYHEKEKTWEKELRKIKAIYDNRLKASQQRALKMEQMLTMHTYQLQQEKRKLRQEMDELRRDKEQQARQNQELKQELGALRSQLEDTEWGLCQKSGEISLLKSQLKDCQGDQTTRNHELLHIRAQVREYAAQLETKEVDNKRLQAETQTLREQALDRRSGETSVVIAQLQREMERLKSELSFTQEQAQEQKEAFEEERLHWLDEKQKVVNYQKQLQLNYMEMYKRNKSLELELSSRESKLNSSGESQC